MTSSYPFHESGEKMDQHASDFVVAQDRAPSSRLRVLDLFSGVGAYSLGLQRTGGFAPIAFCEISAFCRNVLAKNWPDVPSFEDVRTLDGGALRRAGLAPDWIVAGWPCQGNSLAGTGLGMDDPRSGLWSEIRRLAGELRPQGLLLENSSNLLNINDGRDFGRVLGDLAALGFDAEWHCLSAAAFDAPHIRDRVWIVATLADADTRQCGDAGQALRAGRHAVDAGGPDAPHAHGERAQVPPSGRQPTVALADESGEARDASNAPRVGRQPRRPEPARPPRRPIFDGDYSLANIDRLAPIGAAIARQERVSWRSLSDFRGMVHGDAQGLDGFAVTTDRVPDRVERIHALGNLNPPIIPEMIGRAILAAATSTPSDGLLGSRLAGSGPNTATLPTEALND